MWREFSTLSNRPLLADVGRHRGAFLADSILAYAMQGLACNWGEVALSGWKPATPPPPLITRARSL